MRTFQQTGVPVVNVKLDVRKFRYSRARRIQLLNCRFSQADTVGENHSAGASIETAAQDRADATVEKIRRETERTYHLEFDRAIREIRSDQNRNFNQKLDEAIGQFRETLEGLAREYSGKLQDLETGRIGSNTTG